MQSVKSYLVLEIENRASPADFVWLVLNDLSLTGISSKHQGDGTFGGGGFPRLFSIDESDDLVPKRLTHSFHGRFELVVEVLEQKSHVKDMCCGALEWPIPWVRLIQVINVSGPRPIAGKSVFGQVKANVVGEFEHGLVSRLVIRCGRDAVRFEKTVDLCFLTRNVPLERVLELLGDPCLAVTESELVDIPLRRK